MHPLAHGHAFAWCPEQGIQQARHRLLAPLQLTQQRCGVAAEQHPAQGFDLQFAGAHALGEQPPEGAQSCLQETTAVFSLIQHPAHPVGEGCVGRVGVAPQAGGGKAEGPSRIR